MGRPSQRKSVRQSRRVWLRRVGTQQKETADALRFRISDSKQQTEKLAAPPPRPGGWSGAVGQRTHPAGHAPCLCCTLPRSWQPAAPTPQPETRRNSSTVPDRFQPLILPPSHKSFWPNTAVSV